MELNVSYYPGCSLDSTAVEYNESIKDVCSRLDIVLNELKDWNCCGATSAHCIDEDLSFQLSARNLEIAEKDEKDLVIPCSGCFNRIKTAEKNALHNTHFSEKSTYQGSIKIMDMLTFLSEKEILPQSLPEKLRPKEVKSAESVENLSLKDAVEELEKETIKKVLEKVKGNKLKAAEILEIDRKSLYTKIKKYEL